MSRAIYGVDIQVNHYVEIEAESQDEAEELAMDAFQDAAGWWDEYDLDFWIIEELDDEEKDNYEDDEDTD